MTNPNEDGSKSTAMRKLGEADRSDEFKAERDRIIDETGKFARALEDAQGSGRPLKNGLTIQPGTSRVSTELADNGRTKQIMTNTYYGAFLRREKGGISFEMADRTEKGSRFMSVAFDELETSMGEFRESGIPATVAGVYEEIEQADGTRSYFGADVLSDGDVRLRHFDVQTGGHAACGDVE